ncbi:MAG: hypothetical protein HQ490_10825 [Lutibacter sp.]|nr:hypothetical protein [Lutibacter sp.]
MQQSFVENFNVLKLPETILDLKQESTFEKLDISTKLLLQKCLYIEKDVIDSINIATINTAVIFRKAFFIL